MNEVHELDSSRDEAAPRQAAAAVSGAQPPVRVRAGSDEPDSRVGDSGASSTTATPRLNNTSPFELLLHDDGEAAGAKVFTSPAIDGGFGAWSYVAGAFAMYIVVWGFPQAYPVIGTFLTVGENAEYPRSVVLSLLAPGIQDIIEGFLFQVLPVNVRLRLPLLCGGIATILIGMLWASWATAAWEVFVSLGIVSGVGGVILNFVHVSVFSEWFDKKRGQAMGIIWLGFRLGALGCPLISQYLLVTHGYRRTIQVLIAPAMTLLIPSILLLRGRHPTATVKSTSAAPAVSTYTALHTPSALFHLFAGTLFYAVVNVPKMFIMAYAADMGLTPSEQAYAFVVLILSTMVGTYTLGWLSDMMPFQGLVGLAALITSFSHVFILGFARQKIILYVYAFFVGVSIGGFDNAMFSLYTEIAGGDGRLFTAIHAVFSLFRGAANLSVGPVGVALLRSEPTLSVDSYALGKYKLLVAYAGTMSFACAALIGMRMLYPKHGGRTS
ncbi:hypothetical protein LTR37_006259 [Vermiconidia calcicola]|uniref:Uncharacterized protein n=1 Tax=Vermiconidia calcicola TaxID=1690605 RepID=A0ACC3NHQ5_9PEZI|nr:hypothetical protein LTR37_006259 [Vermiconidia calcicola]